jgi:hypothetical protein
MHCLFLSLRFAGQVKLISLGAAMSPVLKPMDFPSGEKNGPRAPSVPGIGFASKPVLLTELGYSSALGLTAQAQFLSTALDALTRAGGAIAAFSVWSYRDIPAPETVLITPVLAILRDIGLSAVNQKAEKARSG